MSDKVYTSNFTGSQIDEAVGKVINNEIGGEAIKEGSIPLSALADDVKDKLNNIFIAPDDFIEEQYDEPDEDGFFGKVKQVYVTDILENRYNKISIFGVIGDIKITDDFIMLTFKYEVFQSGLKQESYTQMFINVQDCKFKQVVYLNKSPFAVDEFSTDAATNIKADIRYNFVKSVTDSEITIPEENKQLFKKNMGSFADWNAKQGEAGYIENKPFYVYVVDTITSGGEYNMTLSAPNVIIFSDKLIVKCADIETNKQYTINSGPSVKLTYTGTLGNYIVHIDDEYGYINENNPIIIGYIYTINEMYLPDTVIKTTPQTLSTTAKNQALANLGIDPVALKYMINPLELDYQNGSMDLPEDLANIVLTNGRFNGLVFNKIIGFVSGVEYCSVTRCDYMYDYNGKDCPALWFNNVCYALDPDNLLFTLVV